MKIAIVGSRDYPDLQQVWAYVSALPKDSVIVSGGARGVDRTAEQAAKAFFLETLIFPADWNKYGKRAGYIRNAAIIEAADKVVAFWDGKSKGTSHSIGLAKERNKPLEIFGLQKHD